MWLIFLNILNIDSFSLQSLQKAETKGLESYASKQKENTLV